MEPLLGRNSRIDSVVLADLANPCRIAIACRYESRASSRERADARESENLRDRENSDSAKQRAGFASSSPGRWWVGFSALGTCAAPPSLHHLPQLAFTRYSLSSSPAATRPQLDLDLRFQLPISFASSRFSSPPPPLEMKSTRLACLPVRIPTLSGPPHPPAPYLSLDASVDLLARFLLEGKGKTVVLTGAGVSVDSGIRVSWVRSSLDARWVGGAEARWRGRAEASGRLGRELELIMLASASCISSGISRETWILYGELP
jgi:hypothetical protein